MYVCMCDCVRALVGGGHSEAMQHRNEIFLNACFFGWWERYRITCHHATISFDRAVSRCGHFINEVQCRILSGSQAVMVLVLEQK